VSAAFGQGVNSALEDCTVLADALAGAPGDVDAALAAYERRRLPLRSTITLTLTPCSGRAVCVRAPDALEHLGACFQGTRVA